MDHASAFEANRRLWNARVPHHLTSRMYDMPAFLAGKCSLTEIELSLLGEVKGKRILHLQCHFGQDTLSLARMGAEVTGLDISDAALAEAKRLTDQLGLKADWVLSNVVDHVPALDAGFDIVFTSFGTIGWLPDLKPWAANIQRYLKPAAAGKPGGQLVFVEFHPALWMFDNGFTHVQYSYFNREAIIEDEQGTYADRAAAINLRSFGWNHDLGEVLSTLIDAGLMLERFTELDGSPHDCFANTVRGTDGLFRIEGMEGKLPMVYGLSMRRG